MADVPERPQVGHGRPDATGVVERHGWDAPHPPVDQDDRQQVRSLAQLGVAHAGRAQHDPVDLAGEHPHRVQLDRGVLVGVRQQDREAEVAGARLRTLEHGREERVDQVGHDDPEVAGAAGDQGAGRRVGAVVQLVGSVQDAGPGDLVDLLGAGEGARDGGRRDAGCVGDVAQGRGHGSSSGRMWCTHCANVVTISSRPRLLLGHGSLWNGMNYMRVRSCIQITTVCNRLQAVAHPQHRADRRHRPCPPSP